MASSICSQTHSSGGSEQDGMPVHQATAAHHFATAVAAAAAPQEESLYENLLRYHQESGEDSDDDQSDEFVRTARLRRNARKKSPPYTSGLSPTTEDVYNQPPNTAMDDDRKIPARQVSEDRKLAAKPSTGVTPTPTTSGISSRNSERTYRPATGRRKKPPPSSQPQDDVTTRSAQAIAPIRQPSPMGRTDNLQSLSSNNRNSTPSSFYQAALREAASLEIPEKKPGIIQVNEPAIRSNSSMYRDAYGGDDQSTATHSTPATSSVSRTNSTPSGPLESPFSSQDSRRQQRAQRSSESSNSQQQYSWSRDRQPQHQPAPRSNEPLHRAVPGVAVATKGPPPLHPEEMRSIRANLSRSGSGDSSRGSTPTRNRPPQLPTPMGPEQVRQQLAALKQQNNRAPSARQSRPEPLIPPPMGPNEVQKALDGLKKSKQPSTSPKLSPMNLPLSNSGSMSSPEDDYRHQNAMRGRNSRPQSPSPSHALSSMPHVSSQEGSLYEAAYNNSSTSHHNRTAGRSQQANVRAQSPVRNVVQHPAQRNVRAPSPVPSGLPKAHPAARRGSGATIDPSELMDIGSDEHIRRSREMDRRKSGDLKGMRGSLHRAPASRGASPARSVNTTMTTPNPTINGLLPRLRRDSTQESHSSSSSVGPAAVATVVAAVVKQAPGHAPYSSSSRSGDTGYRPQSHNTPQRSRVSGGNHARPPVTYPHDFNYSHTAAPHQHPAVAKTMPVQDNRQAQAHPYPATTGHERQRQYRQSANSPQSEIMRRHPPYRNASNPNMGGWSGIAPHNEGGLGLKRSNSVDGESTHSGSRASNTSTSNDEEFKLALELSRKEAEANNPRQNHASQMSSEVRWRDYVTSARASPQNERNHLPRSPHRASNDALDRPSRVHAGQRSSTSGNALQRPSGIRHGDRASTTPYVSSQRDGRPSSHAPHVAPTPFAQDAYQVAKQPEESEVDEELLLALKISAEESRAPPPSSHGASASKLKETLNPDEQLRILQQIREEKERKELEMALKASEAESANASRPAPTTNMHPKALETNATSASSGHDPRDFLVSQQKAMEEYQRSRGTSSAGPTAGRLKDPPPPASKDAEDLLLRGAMETQQAISSGRARIVKCQKCGARLQAPVSYSLVYCPQCQTVSPA